jgi:flavin-dependent dehydrogenase
MSTGAGEYDVAIVGASTAGCTAARLFALRGARVALIERRPAVDAYKTVCTHFIQSSATPTIEKLGLAPLIEARGAVRNSIDVWTPGSGWIVAEDDSPRGYNVTRRTLDPILRKLAGDTAGVELIAGWTEAKGSAALGPRARLAGWCGPSSDARRAWSMGALRIG